MSRAVSAAIRPDAPLPAFGAAPRRAVAAQPLPQQVANYVRDLIIHDALKPGDRIREQHISEQLQVSRTPMREALKILAAERLIDILPNRGAVVVRASVDEIRAMLKVYSTLEVLGAELACEQADTADIAEVKKQYKLQQAAFAAKDRLAYFRANQAFHLAIIAASHNPVLAEMHRHLNMRLYRIRYLGVLQVRDWASAVHQHDKVLKAFIERDGMRLGRLLQDHLGFAWRQADGTAAVAAETTKPATRRQRRR
jgi:DNA-binding GntR family transcriptional regulator